MKSGKEERRMNEQDILERIRRSYQLILGPKLVGIYVHGSIAFGCFHWDSSDIDFIAVVNQALTLREKQALIQTLLDLKPFCPKKGVEMSVVSAQYCKIFLYPTPYELHFSIAHEERAAQNLTEYCQMMQGTDKDLAAHFTVIRQSGLVLCGAPICQTFGPVPREAYWDSICADIRQAEEDIFSHPVYTILNLCRVLAYKKDGQILSKADGSHWGIKKLPPVYGLIIQKAISAYETGAVYSFSGAERDFAAFMLEQIAPRG